MTKKIFKKFLFLLRYITSYFRMEPSFIIVGEARCGTTSLFNYICQNSKVLEPIKKEIHFFDYNYNKGKSWYKSFFNFKKNNKISGEATPYYFSHPKAAERIKLLYPNIKIILILRNPADRAISSFYKQRSLGIEKIDSIEVAFDAEENRLKNSITNMLTNHDYDYNHKNFAYKTRSTYYYNLNRWKSIFKSENLLVFEFDQLYSNIEYNYKKTLKFLDVEYEPIDFKHFNKGFNKIENPKFRDNLAQHFKKENQKLFSLLNKRFDWN